MTPGHLGGRLAKLEALARLGGSGDDSPENRALVTTVFLCDGIPAGDLAGFGPIPLHPDGRRVTMAEVRARFAGRIDPASAAGRLLSAEPDEPCGGLQ